MAGVAETGGHSRYLQGIKVDVMASGYEARTSPTVYPLAPPIYLGFSTFPRHVTPALVDSTNYLSSVHTPIKRYCRIDLCTPSELRLIASYIDLRHN
ncbi:hypothetical protein RRG08_028940 [Elysia crispata]|uniref:Uncharacterized protein n=1 Tax=Elysia crispata TaxID=231223 RepID=A0AAE1E2Q0_9GAST|nr:hypothetical protein RRG08_028940 [Elysia crispata]